MRTRSGSDLCAVSSLPRFGAWTRSWRKEEWLPHLPRGTELRAGRWTTGTTWGSRGLAPLQGVLAGEPEPGPSPALLLHLEARKNRPIIPSFSLGSRKCAREPRVSLCYSMRWQGHPVGEIEREKSEELRVDFEKREARLPSPGPLEEEQRPVGRGSHRGCG